MTENRTFPFSGSPGTFRPALILDLLKSHLLEQETVARVSLRLTFRLCPAPLGARDPTHAVSSLCGPCVPPVHHQWSRVPWVTLGSFDPKQTSHPEPVSTASLHMTAQGRQDRFASRPHHVLSFPARPGFPPCLWLVFLSFSGPLDSSLYTNPGRNSSLCFTQNPCPPLPADSTPTGHTSPQEIRQRFIPPFLRGILVTTVQGRKKNCLSHFGHRRSASPENRLRNRDLWIGRLKGHALGTTPVRNRGSRTRQRETLSFHALAMSLYPISQKVLELEWPVGIMPLIQRGQAFSYSAFHTCAHWSFTVGQMARSAEDQSS